jgi:hypothetical protein
MSDSDTAPRVWLYTRHRHSIYIVSSATPPRLLVLGPATSRVEHAPRDEQQLIALHSDIEADLRHHGWTFEGRDVERRQSDDRRQWPRCPERRSAAR